MDYIDPLNTPDPLDTLAAIGDYLMGGRMRARLRRAAEAMGQAIRARGEWNGPLWQLAEEAHCPQCLAWDAAQILTDCLERSDQGGVIFYGTPASTPWREIILVADLYL